MTTAEPAEVRVDRPVRRHPLEVECLYTDDRKTLMSKGHHDPAEFRALDMREASLGDWRAVEHGFDDSKTPNA